ncbi:MAG: DUF1330 domain-containing protein [Alphaproteobacteria bacterium]|nr:DUF1330 domain-containing protein [Alphaproteobacteria bacterium]
MAVYAIGDIDVFDQAGYERYMREVPEIVEKYGGRYLVRGGPAENLEGDWHPRRIVVLEFPTMAALQNFYRAHDFAELKAQRQAVSRSRMIAVEGV